MKNRYLISTLIFIVIVLLCCVTYNYYKINKPARIVTKETERHVEESKPIVTIEDAKTFEEIENYITKNEKALLIIGREGCQFCTMYLPIVRNASSENSFSYMYVDMTKLANEDYNSLMYSNIRIPAKCTGTGEEKQLYQGFGTPLTLILENGKSYDCIRGYKDKTYLISSLKTAKYIE